MEERTSNISNMPNKVTVNNRKSAAITGVSDVLAFDVNEVLLETSQGMLMIKGNDMHVKRLSLEKGEVDLEGRIDSFLYSDITERGTKRRGSVMERLFR